MKYVICCLIGMLSVPAIAENTGVVDDTIAVEESQDMAFLRNYDAKIKKLENYEVRYLEPGKKKVTKIASRDSSGLHVRLIPTKKKS